MKKSIKYILLSLLIIIGIIIYFSFPIIITYDGSNYINYLSIFEGTRSIKEWDVIRGIVFPFIIYVSTIFGHNVNALKIVSFIFYVITNIGIYYLLKNILKDINDKLYKTIFISFFLILIFLNPIIFGYFHTLLTEYVAMCFSVIGCLLSYLWLKSENKIKYLYSTLLIILVPLAWHLKQPYTITIFFPLLISSILKIINNHKLKNIIYVVLVIIISLSMLFGSIKLWNYVLRDNNTITTNNQPDGMIGSNIIGSIKNLKVFDKNDNYRTYEVTNHHGKKIDTMKMKINNGAVDTKSGLKFYLKLLTKHPLIILDAYYSNYLVSSNIYYIDDMSQMTIKRDAGLYRCRENCDIAFRIYDDHSNVYFLQGEMYNRVTRWEVDNNTNLFLKCLYQVTSPVSVILFTYLFILLPFVVISLIIFRIKYRHTKLVDLINLELILLGYSLLHILVFCMINSIIDRYHTPAYIINLIGYPGYIYLIIKIIKYRKETSLKK